MVVRATNHLHHVRDADFGAVLSTMRDADVEGRQLGPAPFDFERVGAELDDCRLQFFLNGGAHVCSLEMHPDRLAFVVFIDRVGGFTVNAAPLPAASLLSLGPGRTYVMRGESGSIVGTVSVSPARLQKAVDTLWGGGAAERMGHHLFPLGDRTGGAVTRAFRRMLRLSLLPQGGLASDEVRRVLAEEAMMAVVSGMAEVDATSLLPSIPTRASHRAAYMSAREFLEAHDREAVTMEALCGATGFSARVIHYAFREYTGLGPIRYHRLQRLAHVRAALEASAAPTRVAEIATQHGFFEFGRFARDYRAVYGERPSATLAQPARTHAGEWSLACLRP